MNISINIVIIMHKHKHKQKHKPVLGCRSNEQRVWDWRTDEFMWNSKFRYKI